MFMCLLFGENPIIAPDNTQYMCVRRLPACLLSTSVPMFPKEMQFTIKTKIYVWENN
jgi:hypothetical protein